MAKRSRFQAPRVLSDFAGVLRALREVQESLDSVSSSRAELRMNLRSFNLTAGNFQRASAPAAGMQARLPKASGENLGDAVTLHLEGMLGQLDVFAAPGDTVNGQGLASYTEDGVVVLWSNGVNAWSSVAQVPTNSPAAPDLDAEYVVGTADPDLPNARVATASTEITPDIATPNVISWALNAASVAFSKLANLTGLSVLGRAANSSGVMAAITATAARQTLRANDAGTALEWGHPVEVRDSGADQGDVHSLDFVAGTNVNLAASVAGGVATITPSVDLSSVTYTAGDGIDLAANQFSADVSDFAGAGLEDDGSNNLRLAHIGFGVLGNPNFATTAAPSLITPPGPYAVLHDDGAGLLTFASKASTSIVHGAGGVYERAAITGAVSLAQNSNTSQFAGNRVNDTALANLEFLDFASTSTITVAANDAFAGAAGTTCRYTFDVNQAAGFIWTGIHTFQDVIRLDGTFTATLAATTSNLAIGDANHVSLTLTGSQSLTGMVPAADDQLVWLENADSIDFLTIEHDVTSTAANRFYCPFATAYQIPPRSGVWARYNGVLNRWILADAKQFVGVAFRVAPTVNSSNKSITLENSAHLAWSFGTPVGSDDVSLVSTLDLAADYAWSGWHQHDLRASSPTVSSGFGAFWATTSNLPVFTGDDNVDQVVFTTNNIASQAQMEAGSDVQALVGAGRQHFHPSACKAWGRADTTSLVQGYNVSSATDGAAGVMVYALSTSFSANTYLAIGGVTATAFSVNTSSLATGSVTLTTYNTSNTAADPSLWHFVAFGDQ